MLKTILWKKKNNNKNKTTTITTTSLSRSQTTGCNKWQRITNLGTALMKGHKYSSFCQSSKRCEEKWGFTHQQRQLTPVCVDAIFTEILHLLAEQTNVYYQQHLDRQAGPSSQLPDITLPDMMTFIALALQMGHPLNNTLHGYWSRLRLLWWEHDTRQIFTHTVFSAFCRQSTDTWRRWRIWPRRRRIWPRRWRIWPTVET